MSEYNIVGVLGLIGLIRLPMLEGRECRVGMAYKEEQSDTLFFSSGRTYDQLRFSVHRLTVWQLYHTCAVQCISYIVWPNSRIGMLMFPVCFAENTS